MSVANTLTNIRACVSNCQSALQQPVTNVNVVYVVSFGERLHGRASSETVDIGEGT